MRKDNSTSVSDLRLQPALELRNRLAAADQPYRFAATTEAEAKSHQARVRTALSEALGFVADPAHPPAVIAADPVVDKGDYLREKLRIETAKDSVAVLYLLRPKHSGRETPVVLALHGHGYGAKDIVGLWEDGSERGVAEGYQRDFAVMLCRAGFVVAAPEIACFGERENDYTQLEDSGIPRPVPTSCAQSAALAFHLGASVLGMRIRDGMRVVDYLETRTDMDAKRLGAMGISGGGMHALFSAAIDSRITAVAVSGYFSTFRDSVLAMDHCFCNYVPGLARFGEMADIAALIAPRPFFSETGTHDPIFPISAARSSIHELRRHYGVFGAEDNVHLSVFEGRHRVDGTDAIRFLKESLGL